MFKNVNTISSRFVPYQINVHAISLECVIDKCANGAYFQLKSASTFKYRTVRSRHFAIVIYVASSNSNFVS